MVIKFTYRKHMEIKNDLFTPTATANGWWGNIEVFGQRSGAKALIFVRLLYIMSAYVFFYPLSILKYNSYKKHT